MSEPRTTQIKVYSKVGDLIASFDNPVSTPNNPSAALSDDERRELMVEPTVKLVQNGESSFTFKMLVSSEKFHLIKGIGNRFHVNGRVYTALTDDAIVYGYEGEDARVATVTLVEEQYTLQKKFVQAYNVMPYSKSLATSSAACVEYNRTDKIAEIATFVIASSNENFSKALLWDITDTIYILEPSDTWEEPPKYVNPVSITKTEESITIMFYNLGGAIPLGATALFGAGIESIDDHTVTILPKSNKKYKLTIDGVQYEDSVVLDERGVLMPRGSGGYALWSVIRHTGWRLGTCDMLHTQFNTSQVDAVCESQVRDFTGIYGTYKESSGTWVFDLAQSTDSAFRRALNWAVDDTLYVADISTIDGAPEWTDAPDSAHITYFNATDSRITVKIDSTGTIANDCVVAFSNAGSALEAKFVIPSTDAGFSLASTWESGYSLSVYDAVGWADAPVSARIISNVVNSDGNLEITILNLGGLISAGATVRLISGNEIGVFNCETDAKDIFDNIKLIQELWGGVIVFDSFHKVIHYRDEDKEGTDFNTWNGFTIKRGKNLTASPSVSWNADIITRLYPLGADKLNIELVNDGKRYVDDFSFTDEILEGYVEQPNIYDTLDDGGMLQLLYWARREVSKVCRPRMTVKYENKVVDRRQIGGYEFDTFDLNSIVKAYYTDSEIGEETSQLLRVVNWEYDVWNPLVSTTVEVGDIKANVRDIFKLIYKKTEEMPAFDAKGRISADDISVGSSSSSSSRRGGGGGGGGGTLADTIEEQIKSNAYFYQKFDDQASLIGMVAEFSRTTDEYARSGLAALDIKVDDTASALQASVQHTYDNLIGEITQTDSTLRLWAEDSFASAELTTRFNNLTSGMGNYTSIKQYADATYAKTEIETWVNNTRTYLAVAGSAITMGSGGQFVQVGLGTVLLRGTYVDLDGSNVEIGNVGSIIKMWGDEVEFYADSFLTDVSVDTNSIGVATFSTGYTSIDALTSVSLAYSTNSGEKANYGYIITSSNPVTPINGITVTRQTVSGVSVITGITVSRVDASNVSTKFVRFPTGTLTTEATLSRTYVNSVRGVLKNSSSRTFVTKKL
jgi:hypothetical protein